MNGVSTELAEKHDELAKRTFFETSVAALQMSAHAVPRTVVSEAPTRGLSHHCTAPFGGESRRYCHAARCWRWDDDFSGLLLGLVFYEQRLLH